MEKSSASQHPRATGPTQGHQRDAQYKPENPNSARAGGLSPLPSNFRRAAHLSDPIRASACSIQLLGVKRYSLGVALCTIGLARPRRSPQSRRPARDRPCDSGPPIDTGPIVETPPGYPVWRLRRREGGRKHHNLRRRVDAGSSLITLVITRPSSPVAFPTIIKTRLDKSRLVKTRLDF